MRSIRRYLVTLLIAILTLTSFMAALKSYRQSIEQAELLFDQDLNLLAASFHNQFAPDGDVEIAINAVQVWRQDQLLYRSPNAPLQKILAPSGFSEQNFSGKRWRVFQSLDNNQLQVIVAQPLKERQALANEVVLASIYPVVLSLPLQALLIWWVVSKGLKPLRRLTEQLADKKADDLSPVALAQVPNEMRQMLDTTNLLLNRLSDAFTREKRFASDVAHELRTPLSVLQINLHNAEQQWQAAQIADPDNLMPALQQGVARMSQLIEQIMLFNRTNPEHFKAKLQSIEVVALCQEVIAELYPQLLQKDQQIELEADNQVQLLADPFAFKLLLINILGNAIKYTPAGGQVVMSLYNEAKKLRLVVEDSGPGIDESEYQRVFDRFYRVGGDRHSSGELGSGLGLAIVRDVVHLHQGSIALAHSRFASGLKVIMEFPL
jgi:two-component system sensor histidine kinase QseC